MLSIIFPTSLKVLKSLRNFNLTLAQHVYQKLTLDSIFSLLTYRNIYYFKISSYLTFALIPIPTHNLPQIN